MNSKTFTVTTVGDWSWVGEIPFGAIMRGVGDVVLNEHALRLDGYCPLWPGNSFIQIMIHSLCESLICILTCILVLHM